MEAAAIFLHRIRVMRRIHNVFRHNIKYIISFGAPMRTWVNDTVFILRHGRGLII